MVGSEICIFEIDGEIAYDRLIEIADDIVFDGAAEGGPEVDVSGQFDGGFISFFDVDGST